MIIRVHYWSNEQRKQMHHTTSNRDELDQYLFWAKLQKDVVGWEIYKTTTDISIENFRAIRDDIKQSWVIDSWYDRSAFYGKKK